MAPIRAVMFDLDGTLLNTIADIAHAMNSVLRRHGLPEHAESAYRQMVGSGLEALVQRATWPKRVDVDLLVGDLARQYASNPTERSRPYPGVPELLEALERSRVVCTILSNKADELVQQIVPGFFGARFSIVRGLLAGAAAKPDPRGALSILQQTGFGAEETIFLGDSDVDMETARRAGMVAVGAAWGFRGEEELRASGAEHIIHEPTELLELVGS